MNNKIYIVETASYNAKSAEWDNNTSRTYFASKKRAKEFCEEWMAIYKKSFPDGIMQNSEDGIYQFIFDGGYIEEYQYYSVELH